ncbi:MAG: LPS assembly protein LptD, partial [Alphaproteobacteria bacterium]|nr:LPS assembly protein LptD [Alphaproteobacteria bacterium]
FEFDDSYLFIPNRFVGLDRVEGGKRVDYGIRLGTYGSKGGNATAFIGQSYRLRDDSTFQERSGLEDHFSDYVGNVQIRPGRHLDVLYRFRLDKENLSPILNDLSFGAGPSILRVYTNYIDIEGGAGSGNIEERKEVSFGASSQFHENWSITANAVRDLTSGGGMVLMSSGLTYEDECFSILSNY